MDCWSPWDGGLPGLCASWQGKEEGNVTEWSQIGLSVEHYRLFVCLATFLASTHAYCKVSPFFSITWFGSSLVLGWFWSEGTAQPEAILLPGLVVYVAAALTKGIVESRPRLRGNHLVHVIVTGLFTGVVSLPLESAARTQNWVLPREISGSLLGLDAGWFGGTAPLAFATWGVLGTLYYGLYKLLDHAGLGGAAQVVLLFAATPFVGEGVQWVLELIGAG